jgi:hypothetical protein
MTHISRSTVFDPVQYTIYKLSRKNLSETGLSKFLGDRHIQLILAWNCHPNA